MTEREAWERVRARARGRRRREHWGRWRRRLAGALCWVGLHDFGPLPRGYARWMCRRGCGAEIDTGVFL